MSEHAHDIVAKREVLRHGAASPEGGEPPRPPDPPGDADDDGPDEPRLWGYDLDRMNDEWAFLLTGGKAVIVRENAHADVGDRVQLMSMEAFLAYHLNAPTEVRGADGKIKVVTWASRWLRERKRRTFDGLQFHPNPDGVPGRPGYLNLWRGFAVEPKRKKNGYVTFRDHLLTNICRGDEAHFNWLFATFAHMVQRPRERIGTAIVLKGKMGTGKTKVGEVIGSLFPDHYFLVSDPRYLVGQFNAHMACCLLLQADEAFFAGDPRAEGRLKDIITAPTHMIERKGIDPVPLANYVRVIMTSNEDWVVPAGKDERRFAVFEVDPRCAQNTQYFAEMDAELADGGREALLYDLLHFDLSTVDVRKIPKTRALLEQKFESLDHVEKWWLDRLMSGDTTRGANGWVNTVPRDVLIDDYVAANERVGQKRKSSDTLVGRKLAKLVPGLKDTRPWVETRPGEAQRKRCWVFPSLAECRAAFERAVGQTIEWPDDDDGAPPPLDDEGENT